ncbi:MAG: potassium channel protein [Rhizobium sp.]|nr:MAG: potassium channel protein [Rhizobium sp.]
MSRSPPPRHERGRVLFTKAPVSPQRVLLQRATLLVVLFAMVIAALWFDRDGLRDQIDGHISFSDVVYFAMVTVTTVGYGDIVPVTDRARIVDALFLTPVRIFVWVIFFGTAYQFVFQQIWEGFRMSRLRDRLNDHVVICGYGHSGSVAAKEIASKGVSAEHIVVIDESEICVRLAAEAGYIGLRGDPTQENILRDAGIERASSAIVSLGRDDTVILSVLTIRHLNPTMRIIAAIGDEENVKLATQAGANAVVMPSQVNGYLLAESVTNRHTADYVLDLLNSSGRITLRERPALPAEIGKPMREIAFGLAVRIYRKGQPVGFWEKEKTLIEPDDLLLVIEPIGAKAPV